MSVFETIVSRTPVDKGWSGDRKYKALTADGTAYFLRIALENAARVLRWYDDLREIVPNWYHR